MFLISFRRTSQLVTHKVLPSQPQKFALSRSYTNSTLPPRPSPQDSTSYYLNKFNKFAESTAKRLPAAIIAKLVVTVIFGWLSGDLLYTWFQNGRNEYLLYKTLRKGTRPYVREEDELVLRPEIIDRLKNIFQPYKGQSFYQVVCGEYGTGKTTLTKIASREVGQGVIYVEVPPNGKGIENFGRVLGESFNFAFKKHISLLGQFKKKVLGDTNGKNVRLEDPKWIRALDAFKRVGEKYRTKYSKLPVIVYDNISVLDPTILDILQDDAKMNADNKKYIAVFISSKGSVLRRMESRSAWSRVKKPVMEIGDLNKEESMEYLIKKRNIKEADAKKLYDLVGGHIVELKTVADDFQAGQKFEVIKQQVLTEVGKKFYFAKLLEDQIHHEAGKDIIYALLNSEEIDTSLFRKYFKNENVSKILGANVFTYHPSRNTVSFQSQSVKYFIQENSDIFIKEKFTK